MAQPSERQGIGVPKAQTQARREEAPLHSSRPAADPQAKFGPHLCRAPVPCRPSALGHTHASPLPAIAPDGSAVSFLRIATIVLRLPPLAPQSLCNVAAVSSCHFSARESPDGASAPQPTPSPAPQALPHPAAPASPDSSLFSYPRGHARPGGLHPRRPSYLPPLACSPPSSSFPCLLRHPQQRGLLCSAPAPQDRPGPAPQHLPAPCPAHSSLLPGVAIWNALSSHLSVSACPREWNFTGSRYVCCCIPRAYNSARHSGHSV